MQPSLNTTYILTLVTTVVGLFVTQGLIDSNTARLVTGLAAAFVPAILAVAHTFFHAHVIAARITAASSPAPVAPVIPVRKAA